ncbi:hypothetical protein LguiB_025631 [Lonicera macranthoides]
MDIERIICVKIDYWRIFTMVPDHALISNYLSMKVRGDALPVEDEVKEMESHDVYSGGIEPWDIFAMHAKYPDEPVWCKTLFAPKQCMRIGCKRSFTPDSVLGREVWEKPEKIKFYEEDRQELLAGAAAA